MDDKNIIGDSIRYYRIEAGLTQPQLANKIGVSHASISYWENGVNTPNVADCWRLADVFHISIDELIGRKQ